jgi:formylglycine-generating enzyme
MKRTSSQRKGAEVRSRKGYLGEIENALKKEYRVKDPGTKAHLPPIIEHVQTGIEFALLPGGVFTMGFTDAEEKAARAITNPPPIDVAEMRPAHARTVRPFLISTTPMLLEPARRVFGDAQLSPLLNMVEYNPHAPVYVTREAASAMVASLGCRLPFEAEWEYACRGNTSSLFVWGDRLPPERTLAQWLDFGLPPRSWKSNAFGLALLFAGEWCLDEWTASHQEGAQVKQGVFVIKGGGSIFWPWQDEEWIWCMPARRMPSTGLTSDRSAAFRLVRELPDFDPQH